MQSSTKQELDQILSKGDLPVIIDFWAPWCGPCKTFTPAFEAVAEQMAGQAHFLKMNADDEIDTLRDYGVRGVPTCLVLVGGAEVMRHTGTMSAEALKAFLERSIKPARDQESGA